MKRKLLLTCMFIALIGLSTHAQWQPIGPGGGIVRCFASGGTNIFAGTFGGGVFLTTDNGGVWAPVNTGITNTNVQALAVTNNGATVFAGTYGDGVFLSTDAGANWTTVNSGLTNPFVSSLAIKGTAIFAGTIGGVFISNDNGSSWTAVNNGLTALDVLCITISGTDILAGTGSGGVFLSTNDGGNWTQKNTGLGDLYVNSLAVNGTKLFAGNNNGVYSSIDNGTNWLLARSTPGLVKSIDINGTTIFAGYGTMVSGGIDRSTDSGSNWTTVNTGLPSGNGIYAILQSGSTVFSGTDGKGLYTSANNGGNWASDPGIVNTNAQSLSLATIGTDVFAGVFGGGVYLSSSNGSGPWVPVNSGLPTNSINTLATDETTAVFVGTYANGVYRSTNNGTSWTAMNTGLTNMNVTSFAINGTYIYAGTFGGGVFRAAIGGGSWTAVNTGISNSNIQSLATSGTKVFAGTYYGGVFYSNNSGASWTAVNTNLTNLNVNTLAISGTRIFAGTLGGVFTSNDDGSSWFDRNIGLTDLDAMSLLVNGTQLFLGTDGGGVFFSNDSANNWSEINTGLTISNNFPSLAISGSAVFAGSMGGGVWRRPLSDFDFAITTQSADVSACANNDIYFSVAATGINITYQWQVSYDGGTQFYDCFNGLEYSGVYTNTLTIIGGPAFFSGFQYHCVITSGVPVNSTLATLTINETPDLSIVDPPATCLPNTIDITNTFTDLSTSIGTISYWTDAGATNPLTTPSTINTTGTYYIKKTAGACSDIKPVTVIIDAIPDLSIIDPLAECLPNTVDITTTFTDLNATTGTVSYWADAGATIQVTTPTAITSAGTYYIKKIVAGGCSDIEPVTVTINAKPNLSITNPPAICFPNTVDITVVFTDLNATSGTVTYWLDSAATTPLTAPSAVTASGTYFIQKIANGGCKDIKSVKVIIRPLPIVSYTQSPLIVCDNDSSLTLSGGSPTGGTYSGTGVTTNVFDPSITGSGNWNIVYTYTDIYTCTDTASQSITVDLCSGIESVAANNLSSVTVFPNPFSSTLNITGIFTSADILIYNILGAQVSSWKTTNNSTTLEMDHLPCGVYLLQVKTENGILTKRIIKE